MRYVTAFGDPPPSNSLNPSLGPSPCERTTSAALYVVPTRSREIYTASNTIKIHPLRRKRMFRPLGMIPKSPNSQRVSWHGVCDDRGEQPAVSRTQPG